MRPALPHSPSAPPGLTGLWALLETQNTLLREGRADDLPAITVQLQAALVHAQRFAHTAPREDLLELQRLAGLNLDLLQRRLADNQGAIDALGPHIPAIAEARSRSTYAAAGRLGVSSIPGRALGRA
jgi:hypothetical protein